MEQYRRNSVWKALLIISNLSAALVAFEAQAQSSRETQQRPDRPIVCAHYMHSYVLGEMWDGSNAFRKSIRSGVEDFEQWPPNEKSERQWWSQRLAPMAQVGKQGVEEDFELGEAAGIDAFGMLMGVKHLPKSAFSKAINTAAEVAMKRNLKIYPDLWDWWDITGPDSTAPSHDDMVKYGQHVKDCMDQHEGAFLRYQDKFVICLGDPLRMHTAKGRKLTWDDFKAFAEPFGGPQNFYVILNTSWKAEDVANGGWGSEVGAFSQWAATYGWGDRKTDLLLQLAKKYDKGLAWPVHTSYFGGREGAESSAETLGLSAYMDGWREAITHKAEFIIIQTWNDFSEDHAITESNYTGNTLIEITRYLSDTVHHHRPPAIEQDRAYLFHHRQKVDAELTEATVHTLNSQWHETPLVDYLYAVTFLTEPAQAEVRIGVQHWQIDVPAGMHEWLIYLPMKRKAPNARKEAYTRPESYPKSSKYRTVTVAGKIVADVPKLIIRRDGSTVIELISRVPLAGSGKWQDLSLIGTGSTAQDGTK